MIVSGKGNRSQIKGKLWLVYKGREVVAALRSFKWKSVLLYLTFLQQSWWNGFHCPHGLRAGGVDEGLRKEEAVVSRVPQLKCKCIWDAISVGPVDGAARTDIWMNKRSMESGLKSHLTVECNLSNKLKEQRLGGDIRLKNQQDSCSWAFKMSYQCTFRACRDIASLWGKSRKVLSTFLLKHT